MSVKTKGPGVSVSGAKGKSHPVARVATVETSGRTSPWWIALAGCGAALVAALIAYWPAMQGRFVFDDVYMRFALPHPESYSFRAWVAGARPLTDFTYWLNFQIGGANPFGYHLAGVLFHTGGALLVFLIVRKILELAAQGGTAQKLEPFRNLIAAFCGAIFLLHPVQTEAVAYIAQRSENLSVLLAFAAWACFLYRRSNAINFPTVLAVVLLFGISVGAKEHVAMLPLVILLTDYYWNPGFH